MLKTQTEEVIEEAELHYRNIQTELNEMGRCLDRIRGLGYDHV